MATTEELYTVVENPTDSARTYGYLGPRGMRLNPGEAVAIPGDLVASLGFLAQHGGRRRKFQGLERSLQNSRLRINSRPTPILYDDINEKPYALRVQAGILGVVDPEYVDPEDSESSESL